MPTVCRIGPYRLLFYSNEGGLREPMHVHVKRDSSEAKVWLTNPVPKIARSTGFADHELSAILDIVAGRRDEIEAEWNGHFGI